jgi:acyl-CoA thioesterase
VENFTEIAKQTLERDNGFIKNNDYRVIKVEQNFCILEGNITESSKNHLGIVHGGYIFGLVDTAAGIAAMTNNINVVTLDANINYFKPVSVEKIFAKAEVVKKGKTVSVYDVLVSDNDDNLLAKATITYFTIG